MKTSIQIIQNYENQDLPCVMVSIDSNPSAKYIFNLPETTQRFASDHKLNFQKGQIFFLTRLDARAMAGLPGMMCTLNVSNRADSNKIYGPEGLVEFFEDINYLMYRNQNQFSGLDLKSQKKQKLLGIDKEGFEKMIEDESIIHPNLNLQKNLLNFKEIKQKLKVGVLNDAEDFINKQGNYEDKNVLIHILDLEISENKKKIFSYVIQTQQIPGSMNKQKLQESQIPKQSIGIFMKTGVYKFEDGREIYLNDYKEQDQPSQLIFILDLPDLDYLVAIQKNKEFQSLVSNNQAQQKSCAIHLNWQMAENPNYLEFVKKYFDCENLFCRNKIYLDEKSQESQILKKEYLKRHTQTIRLNNLFEYIFPDFEKKSGFIDIKNQNDPENFNSNFINALPYKEFLCIPLKSKGYFASKLSQKQEKEDLFKEADNLAFYQEKLKQSLQLKGKEIIFLGTGSMMPLVNRTVSAIYLKDEKNNGILLDIGEGTYAQFIDHFGLLEGELLVSLTSLIIISHIHLDHNMGLLYFLEKREEYFLKNNIEVQPIFILCPYNMSSLLKGYLKIHAEWTRYLKILFIQDFIGEDENYWKLQQDKLAGQTITQLKENPHIDFIEYEHPEEDRIIKEYFQKTFETKKIQDQLQTFIKEKLSINKISLIPVIHCSQSYGVLIEFSLNNLKISYSGDTRPCEKFAQLSENVDVMIHEATFTDELQENAIANKHCTVMEAVQIAQKSKAKYLILTHFSQRYKKVNPECISDPLLKEYFLSKTIMALDHLRVPLNSLPIFPQISRIYENYIPESK